LNVGQPTGCVENQKITTRAVVSVCRHWKCL